MTERTKNHKKREFIIFPTTRGRNWYCGTSSRRYTDFPGAIAFRAAMRPGLSRSTIFQTDKWHDKMVILYYEIHSFRIIDDHRCDNMLPTSQSELALPTTKLVSESFHLTLSRAYRAHFFQLEIRKKSGTF